jgi:murein DD-endopeptidase MepM/ murein hydrolase activator NlpD
MPARGQTTLESYTVKKGDTVAAIAKRYGTTVAAIAASTGLADPNKIKVGQVLFIPLATTYNPDDLDLSEVAVTAQRRSTSTGASPVGDPIVNMVNDAAEWLKPPKLWVTLAVAAGFGYYILSEDRPRRPRR